MPKFEVLVESFIDNKIARPGDIVDYDGFPGTNLKPLDAAGKALARQNPEESFSADRMKETAIGKDLPPVKPTT